MEKLSQKVLLLPPATPIRWLQELPLSIIAPRWVEWQSGVPEALNDERPSSSTRKASLDLAMKCERLFASGMVMLEGTVGELVHEYIDGSDVFNMPAGSNDRSSISKLPIDSSRTKLRRGISPSVYALLKLAYPRRMSLRNPKRDNITYFKLLDIEGCSWTGAIVEDTLLLYLDKTLVDKRMELKTGLVALLDLATDCLNCQRAVVCVDKQISDLANVTRNFFWVGFEMVRVPSFVNGGVLSDAWIAMEMCL
ncbi:ornithine decarboxylase antizyme-domain-containing protein [Dipodascopsis uninucleata]